MGFHLEEDFVADGTIDNRVKGRTVLRINFTNHTSSIITLQGNPCRDLAGSLWSFRNPHAQMDELPGEQCYFIPALCEGAVGCISNSRKRDIPILPPEEHYDRLFDPEQEDPPTKKAPILELEWFSQKYQQVEIDCQLIVMDLIEMVWSLSPEEAAAGEALVDQTREEIQRHAEESMAGFYEEMELIEEWAGVDPEPHELEELCFLIVQEFIIHSADGSDQKQELHNELLKLQEQIAGTFIHLDYDGNFDDVPETISLLSTVIPFIDRASASAQFIAETTAENLLRLRKGIIRLRDELARSKKD
jgi:hypothetical protein